MLLMLFRRRSTRAAEDARRALAARRSAVWRCAACAQLTGSHRETPQPAVCVECGAGFFWRVNEGRAHMRIDADPTRPAMP
jgi:hypothetical protein